VIRLKVDFHLIPDGEHTAAGIEDLGGQRVEVGQRLVATDGDLSRWAIVDAIDNARGLLSLRILWDEAAVAEVPPGRPTQVTGPSSVGELDAWDDAEEQPCDLCPHTEDRHDTGAMGKQPCRDCPCPSYWPRGGSIAVQKADACTYCGHATDKADRVCTPCRATLGKAEKVEDQP
jgi:hypothetical protein